MPIMLIDAIRQVRANVNEPAYPTLSGSTPGNPPPRFYTDTEITDWINDGLRDISRRAETLITFDTSIVLPAYTPTPGQSAPLYPLQSDIIRIQRIEFLSTSGQTYPLQASTPQEMDQIWGTNQSNSSSYPIWWITKGYPGGTGRNQFNLQVYPNPSSGGTLQIYYYRLPIRLADPALNALNYNVTLDIIEGWDDLVVEYATYKAMQKARDDAWKDRKATYEQNVTQMIDVTRKFTDQPSYFSYGARMMPSWLTEWGG